MTKLLIQIDDEIRDMTEDELSDYQKIAAIQLAKEKLAADKATAKAALLIKLGITDDEAALLG